MRRKKRWIIGCDNVEEDINKFTLSLSHVSRDLYMLIQTHVHIYVHTHTPFHPLTFPPPSLQTIHTHTHTPSLPSFLTHTHTHTHTPSLFTHAVTHPPTHAHTHTDLLTQTWTLLLKIFHTLYPVARLLMTNFS